MTAHGLRPTASTLLNEGGKWSPDAIEHSLAHSDKDVVRGIYNRGRYWQERAAMHQWWTDYLDELRHRSCYAARVRPCRVMLSERLIEANQLPFKFGRLLSSKSFEATQLPLHRRKRADVCFQIEQGPVILGRDGWSAGERMLQVSDSEQWRVLSDAARLYKANAGQLAKCA